MLMRSTLGILIIALTAIFAPSAKATLIVDVGDATIVQGGTGFVDVTIASDTDLGLDMLDQFGIELRITTAGGTRLEFVNPPSDSQLAHPNYVLFGNSADVVFGGSVAGAVSTTATINDTYIGGDATVTGTGVPMTTLAKLLVRLDLTAATANPPLPGDTFSISILDSPQTFFLAPDFSSITFTTSDGEVTIIPANDGVVPEPASLAIWSVGALGLTIGASWRRRRIQARSASERRGNQTA